MPMKPDTSAGVRPRSRSVFAVKDCALITLATGRRASTHREFRVALADVDPDCIYHHFWGGLLGTGFEEREYNNDFAAWMHNAMHDEVLAERMALLDPTDHPDMNTLRQELIDLVDERLEEAEYLQWLRATRPFEFMRAKVVVFDTHRRFTHPSELAASFPTLTLSSVFYHFIDARRRLDDGVDDFRAWLRAWGDECQAACEELAAVDPYFVSLEELRDQLAALLRARLVREGDEK